MSFCKKVLVYPINNSVASEIIKSLQTSIHVKLFVPKSEEYMNRNTYNPYIHNIDVPTLTNNPRLTWREVIDLHEIDYIYITEHVECSEFTEDLYLRSKCVTDTKIMDSIKAWDGPVPLESDLNIDCFSDKSGDLLFCRAYKESTSSAFTETISIEPINHVIEKLCEDINKKYQCRGYWHLQLIQKQNSIYYLISTLPSKGIAIWRAEGVNIPLLSIYYAMGNPISLLAQDNKVTTCIKSTYSYQIDLDYQHVYIDLDDTIIVQNRLNTEAIRFIYQCINHHISVHLISKHRGNIYDYLRQYRIESLFDSIIWLTADQKKSEYISYKNSIFVDDAFRERNEVYHALGIPVFDVSAIGMLLYSEQI